MTSGCNCPTEKMRGFIFAEPPRVEGGGYEGVTGMFECGCRAPYTETVEERITPKAEELVKKAT